MFEERLEGDTAEAKAEFEGTEERILILSDQVIEELGALTAGDSDGEFGEGMSGELSAEGARDAEGSHFTGSPRGAVDVHIPPQVSGFAHSWRDRVRDLEGLEDIRVREEIRERIFQAVHQLHKEITAPLVPREGLGWKRRFLARTEAAR